ncbi:MAG: MFS transporter [Deltaproteobacteria bacterium]|nr:MAG: MFS transporter [Deltaproteobacteria bacterium]
MEKNIFSRDFVFAFLAQFAFSFSFFILIPTLPIYLTGQKVADLEMGILVGAFSVSSLILRPLVGRGLSRIPERNFMAAGAVIFIFSFIAYLLAPPFWPFLIVRVFHGIGIAFFYTSAATLIANISPDAYRGRSLSYFFLAYNFAFAVAPSFGMFVMNLSSFTFLFLVCSGISFCSLILTTRLRRREVSPSGDLSPEGRSFLSRKALPPSIMAFFTHIIWGALTAFFPVYAVDQGVSNPGIFFATFAVMLILGRTVGASILDRYQREKILLPCVITYIIAMVLLAFSKTLPMFILVGAIWGAGNAFVFPALVAYTIDLAGASRGPAMGTFTAACDLGVGLGAMVMGLILRLTSFPTMFLSLALVGAINLGYLLFLMAKQKNEIGGIHHGGTEEAEGPGS